jgi:predicted ATP-dependent endonuclease of OLD family
MNISFIGIKNFRKLRDVKIDFSDDTTLFVGANNSGKTSAMDALRKFLLKGDGNNFIYNDFTVTVRKLINNIGNNWVMQEAEKPSGLSDWIDIVPTMDIWLEAENDEFHYVSNIIPTLDWTGGKLGLRLSLFPKDIGKLFDDYREAFYQSRNTENSDKNTDSVKLYPQDLCEFIERHLTQYFEIKTFILDPTKIEEIQDTDFDCECEEKNPMNGLVKIDMIYAQRGLSDADSSNNDISLSQQLRAYYDKHLDIEKKTSPEDLETLSALKKAHETFDTTLATKFRDPFAELEKLGFPGITDPKITIESKFKEKTAFEHDSAVQYALKDDDASLRLPEKYNGLGYQNLISITFKLMSFRDDRIHKGKAASEDNSEKIAPLHLVLLEEPEAHLHVQVQQVLIKKAYEILTDSKVLKDNNFKTQLVVSTHSSHIAKEVPFKSIRYFKRVSITAQTTISTAEIVNLTDTFGTDEKTEKFVQRYLRVTHCDLFFADAVIFVEGTSETVLVPYFIKNDYPELDGRYITVLPVGGSHSHSFKPLIEKLGISTLIITDIDPCNSDTNRSSVQPKRGQPQNIISGNPSLTAWGITDIKLESLLNLQGTSKEFANNSIKIAFQMPVNISLNGTDGEALAATFEDSLIYANLTSLRELTGLGLIKKIKSIAQKTAIDDFCTDIYNVIHGDSSGKVSFALDLIYELDKVDTPQYIKEGLEWLQRKLRRIEVEVTTGGTENA